MIFNLNLLKEGTLIKLKEWNGYWKWENDTIMMYCKDGQVIDILDTKDIQYTLSNIMKDEWEIATEENCPLLRGEIVQNAK